jgi:hypothetical protein
VEFRELPPRQPAAEHGIERGDAARQRRPTRLSAQRRRLRLESVLLQETFELLLQWRGHQFRFFFAMIAL